MRKTRKAAQALLQHVRTDAERKRGGRRASRILGIVQAAERTDATDPCDLAARAAAGAHDRLVLDIDAVGKRVLDRNAHHTLARLLHTISAGAGEVIIDTDDRGALWLYAGDQPFFHRGVVRKRAVTVDMVL